MHKSQSLFYLTTALHVSGVTITHLQEHKTTVTIHTLQNLHEYGSITDTMSLLKPTQKTSLLIPYEQLLIQTFHHNGNLITEQGTGEKKPLF